MKPKRKAGQKIPTPELQGEGSWVILRPAKFGQIQMLMQLNAPDLQTNTELQQQVMGAIAGLIDELLLDWNWVDEDDEPLPKPKRGESSAQLLTMEEIVGLSKVIGSAVSGINEAAKKKDKP